MQNFNDVIERFRETESKLKSLSYATSMLFWDASTGAPKSGADARSQAVGVLSGLGYQMLVNQQMASDLDTLMANLDALDEMNRVLVKDTKKEYDKLYLRYSRKYEGSKLDAIIRQKLYNQGFDYSDIQKDSEF